MLTGKYQGRDKMHFLKLSILSCIILLANSGAVHSRNIIQFTSAPYEKIVLLRENRIEIDVRSLGYISINDIDLFRDKSPGSCIGYICRGIVHYQKQGVSIFIRMPMGPKVYTAHSFDSFNVTDSHVVIIGDNGKTQAQFYLNKNKIFNILEINGEQ